MFSIQTRNLSSFLNKLVLSFFVLLPLSPSLSVEMFLHSGRKWRSLVGALKDKTSLSKATISSTITTSSSTVAMADVAVLRATSYQPSTSPPDPKHISSFLSFGLGSRLTAASAFAALTSRLGSTHNSIVALKCLLLIHHVIHHGSFILQDQLLSFLHPKAIGGRNQLNFSGFRHRRSDHESWENSSWARWYARVLELLVACRKTLGTFVNERPDGHDVEDKMVAALTNTDLTKEMELLVSIMEEARKAPAAERKNGLVAEMVKMVDDDIVAVERRLTARMKEIGGRSTDGISFGDSVELVCLLKRLEENAGGGTFSGGKAGGDLWALVAEVKEKAAAVVIEGAGKAMVRRESIGYDRVRLGLSLAGTVRFGSTRQATLSN